MCACVRERARGLLMDAAFRGALVVPLFLLVPCIIPLVLVGVLVIIVVFGFVIAV